MAAKEIFATVGTTEFDLFITTICNDDVLKVLKDLGYSRLILQIGNGKVIPEVNSLPGIEIEYFRFKDSISSNISTADLVISHAGAGSCLEVLDAGKPLIVVINEELMDNHQLELAERLYIDGHLFYTTCKDLKSTLKYSNLSKLKPFPKGLSYQFAWHLDMLYGFKKDH